MMVKEIITTKDAPKPVGPYSQAVRCGNLLFVSGQVGFDPVSNAIVPGGIEKETDQILKNIRSILAEVDLNFDHILRVGVYLKDMNQFQKFNSVYETFFKGAYPARTTVEVSRLPKDVSIEIEAIAYVP